MPKFRIENDAYYTPDEVARAIVSSVDLEPNRILEPSVGGGAFVRACREKWPRAVITGVDINPMATGLTVCDNQVVGDFCNVKGDFDLIIGNPPFVHAEEHASHAVSLCSNVVMLLRLAFLESEKRKKFWQLNPAHSVKTLVPRPSFTGGGTDSQAYAVFRWRTGSQSATIGHIYWKSDKHEVSAADMHQEPFTL